MRRLLTPSAIVPVVMIAAVAAMVTAANVREGRPHERPFAPVAALGAGGLPTSREGLAMKIADLEARVIAEPGNGAAAAVLADALLRQTRVTGSQAPTMKAGRVLARALEADPDNYELLRMQSTLLLAQHRFAEALTLAMRCRDLRRDDALNHGVIGDAYLELGDYDEAFDAFDRMMRLRPSAGAYARVAYARELQGNISGALESMQLAAQASTGGDLEALAWYRAQVGEIYLRLNQPADALQAFAEASQAFPGHPFAVYGYARALEASGKRSDARDLLTDLVKRAPTPDAYAMLGDLSAAEGDVAAAQTHWAMAEAAWRTDVPEPGDLARFMAERGWKIEEAVAIAEAALQERHDIFTEDAAAWAYFKAGRTGDAKRLMQRAMRTGTKDPDILRHAAAIASVPSQVASR